MAEFHHVRPQPFYGEEQHKQPKAQNPTLAGTCLASEKSPLIVSSRVPFRGGDLTLIEHRPSHGGPWNSPTAEDAEVKGPPVITQHSTSQHRSLSFGNQNTCTLASPRRTITICCCFIRPTTITTRLQSTTSHTSCPPTQLPSPAFRSMSSLRTSLQRARRVSPRRLRREHRPVFSMSSVNPTGSCCD